VSIFKDFLFGLSAGLGREVAHDAYKEGKRKIAEGDEDEQETPKQRADRLEREAEAKLREAAEARVRAEQHRRARESAKAKVDAEVDAELAAIKKKLGR
jgi:predicted metal-dependent hydrolase